ncbi:hypothetical protein EJB05_55937, partial [Eragrostis curvula]
MPLGLGRDMHNVDVFTTDMLDSIDMLLGSPWLLILRTIKCDFSVRSLAFFFEGCHTLPGGYYGYSVSKRNRLQRVGTSPGASAARLPLLEMAVNWMEKFRLYGRHAEAKKLEERIASARLSMEPRVVSVWGLPGVGKSALVRTVYYNLVVMKPLFDRFAWVNVSCMDKGFVLNSKDKELDIEEFCRNLYFDFCPTGSKVAEDCFQQCVLQLSGSRCLIVIDSLESEIQWDSIKVSLTASMLGRNESVARHCALKEEDLLHVDGLEADAVRDLFINVNKVIGEGTFSSHGEMTEEAEGIINKCGRLPAVVIALRSYLAGKQDILGEMKRLKANFMQVLEINPELGGLRDVLTQMHNSYNDCPQVHKKCTFYLSNFPESTIIRRRRLVRRWIAEGYSKGSDSSSMVDYAEKLFQKLADLGITEQPPQTITTVTRDTRMTSCRVISLFLEYIMSREKDEKIFVPLEVSVLKGECNINTERVGQHLVIQSSWKREEIVLENMDLSRLRSLTVFGEWRPCFMSGRMRVLRVLDLEGASNVKDEDLKQIGEFLPRLKFLSLRGCKNITCLPASIGDLGQLQTLDIRDTRIVNLPKSIIKSRKLQYIRAGTIKWDYTAPTTPVDEAVTPAPTVEAEQPRPTPEDTPALSSEAEQRPPATTVKLEQVEQASSAYEELPSATPAEAEQLSPATAVTEHLPPAPAEAEQLPSAPAAEAGLQTAAYSAGTSEDWELQLLYTDSEAQLPEQAAREKELPIQAPNAIVEQSTLRSSSCGAYGMRMTSYRVISLFSEYIMSSEKEEKVFVLLEVSVLEEDCGVNTERVRQHLIIRSSWRRDEIVLESFDLSRLRSLRVFGELCSCITPGRMRVLQVLNLKGTTNIKDEDLKQIMKLLAHLKFLSLGGRRDIARLPASIANLRMLQNLDVSGGTMIWYYTGPDSERRLPTIPVNEASTPAPSAEAVLGTPAQSSETEQPTEIIVESGQPRPAPSGESKLTASAPGSKAEVQAPPPGSRICPMLYSWRSKLRRSQPVSACRAGIEVPAGIAKLTALHTLGIVNVNTAGGKAVLEEVGKLTQLRKLGLCGINRGNCRHLSLVHNLESLSLHFEKGKHAVPTDDIQLPSKIRSLKLYGHVENIPGSIKDLQSLMKLSLEIVTLKQEDVQTIGKLKKLHTLRLRVKNVPDRGLRFDRGLDNANHSSTKLFLTIQVLDIRVLDTASNKRSDVTFNEGALEKLELLEVRDPPPTLHVSGLKNLNSLKKVSLIGAYNDTLKEALQNQLDFLSFKTRRRINLMSTQRNPV